MYPCNPGTVLVGILWPKAYASIFGQAGYIILAFDIDTLYTQIFKACIFSCGANTPGSSATMTILFEANRLMFGNIWLVNC